MRMKMPKTILAMAAILPLAACGTAPVDRAISGAGVGGAAGAAGALIVGGSVGTAAAVGAVAGSVIGAATKGSDINLGKPFWR